MAVISVPARCMDVDPCSICKAEEELPHERHIELTTGPLGIVSSVDKVRSSACIDCHLREGIIHRNDRKAETPHRAVLLDHPLYGIS